MRLRGSLYPNERTLVMTRAHPASLIPALLQLMLASAAASFAATAASSTFLWWLGTVLCVLWMVLALRRVLRWVRTRYAITTHRLVILRGWVSSAKHEALPLDALGPRRIERNTLGKRWGYGTLVVESLGVQHRFRQLPEVSYFAAILDRSWRENYALRAGYMG